MSLIVGNYPVASWSIRKQQPTWIEYECNDCGYRVVKEPSDNGLFYSPTHCSRCVKKIKESIEG